MSEIVIKPWHRNAAVSGLKSRLPFKRGLRAALRRLRPYRPDPENDAYYLENALTMLAATLPHQRPAGRYLEFGTGWTPVMAVVFHAAGYEEATLCDLEPYLDAEGVRRAQDLALGAAGEIAATAQRPVEEIRRRVGAFRADYVTPFDLKSMAPASVDIVASRAVLEHVPAADLPALFEGVARVLRPGAVTAHLIDHSDHFEHQDKSISRVNFLRFGPAAWRAIEGASATSQNRLRRSDFRALLAAAPFETLVDTGAPDPGALAALHSLPLAPEFADRDPGDLATLTSLFVARRR